MRALLILWRAIRLPFTLSFGLLVFFLVVLLDLCRCRRLADRLQEWLVGFDC